MTGVLIRGDGVAARCCANLLARAGRPVRLQPADRPRVPAILIGEPAQQLVCGIFGRADLFRGLPPIRRRIVAWGANAGAMTLEHRAVVVSEEELLHRLGPAAEVSEIAGPLWTVYAANPLPAGIVEHRFGTRVACARAVELSDAAEPEACWIESLEDGWLFLMATGAGAGWLLAIGSRPEELLSESRLIRARVAKADDPAVRFPAAPRLVEPLAGARWIACGTAAMAFDPICGDGTAHAVREAVLASAVIKAAARGEDPDALRAHYRSRLTSAFRRHLGHCRQYYASAHPGAPWWDSECQGLARGMEWCAGRMCDAPARYRLEDLELRANRRFPADHREPGSSDDSGSSAAGG